MTTAAAFIPIKEHSERIPGKNFKLWKSRPLFQWIIDRALESKAFDVVFVDTDSSQVRSYAEDRGCVHIPRRVDLAKDAANGNDLLNHHFDLHPEFDLYFQLFATAPELTAQTIKECVAALSGFFDKGWDSVVTVTAESGWYWFCGQPVNYRPQVLPRSQDASRVLKESTGLYGITRQALHRYRCRIGANPLFHQISAAEAVDIDWPEDLEQQTA